MLLGPGKNGHSHSLHICTFSPLVKQDLCSHFPWKLPSPPPVAEANGCFDAPVGSSVMSVFDVANLPRVWSAPGSVPDFLCNHQPMTCLAAARFPLWCNTWVGGRAPPTHLIYSHLPCGVGQCPSLPDLRVFTLQPPDSNSYRHLRGSYVSFLGQGKSHEYLFVECGCPSEVIQIWLLSTRAQ